MRLHVLMHVPFEGPGAIGQWADAKGYPVTTTHLFEDQPLPPTDRFDRLIVMGGPMGTQDEAVYEWLRREKAFLRETIAAGKSVVGICLGAQLIAEVLGGRVYPNAHKEIGWFDVTLTPEGRASGVMRNVPETFTAFHWHGDTFDLPDSAVWLARTEVCPYQAFLFEEKVLGLQFHLESTAHSVPMLVDNCSSELVEAPYIQNAAEILGADARTIGSSNRIMAEILDQLPV